ESSRSRLPVYRVARSLRRDVPRLSEFLCERSGARRQGAVLQKAALGNYGGLSNDILRGICALGTQTLLETSALSHRGRPLRHGVCFLVAGPWGEEILRTGGSFSRGSRYDPLF